MACMGTERAAIGPSRDDLLERASELVTLEEALRAVEQRSRGLVVLVGGEAGVGKTSLLRRFCEEHGESVRVVRAACDPLFAPRALGPLVMLAEELGGELEGAVGPHVQPHEVALALARELRLQSPTVFVLEDLHWADEATLDVVRLIVRRVETLPALVLASYRDDELERAHPLRRLLGEFATSVGVRRLRLAPLSLEAVARLAEPQGVDPGELFQKTAGNPFFVVEALATGTDEIPATVRDAVLARAARLSAPARSLLEAVAVIPGRAELALLRVVVGDAVEALEECTGCGMLVTETSTVAFRHELARLAAEESIDWIRTAELHRKVLAALLDQLSSAADPSRLAHHAEAAGDVEAAVRFSLAAAERAAALGAHREAAAQYARALRLGDSISAQRRAELLECRSRECYLTDQYDEAIAAIEETLRCRREIGDRLGEGDSLRWLSEVLWCPGRTAQSARAAREAVALLEELPPSRELAKAYVKLAERGASGPQEAVALARRAHELAEHLGDGMTALDASSFVSYYEFATGGMERLELDLERARQAGLVELVGKMFCGLVGNAVDLRRHDVALRHIDDGLEYCGDRGLELFRLYLLASRARVELNRGYWSEAAETAGSLLSIPRTSISPRINALVVLGLVRARRGDPGQWAALDEAWTLAEPTGELWRIGPVAVARAEAGWLAADRSVVVSATEVALPLALEAGAVDLAAALTVWRRRAGLGGEAPSGVAAPYAMQLAGQFERAGELWRELGCPYEAALALADATAEQPLRRALEEMQRLGARPAVALVGRRLRERGVRAVPRGVRPTTRQNPYGLTRRELEVLSLVAEGLQNNQIAERLVLSVRTIDHHVEAILRKLGVRTRGETRTKAAALGLGGPT